MQRHRCCNHAVPATALERSLHIERWESKTKTKRRREKHNQSRPLLSPRTNTPFVPFCATETQNTIPEEKPQIQRVRKFAGSRVPASSLASHQSFNTRSKVRLWIQTHLEAPCAAAQRLSTHAADTTAGLAHAGLALGTASAGRGSLANAEGANTATTTGTATRCLGRTSRGSHALFHGQLKLVN